MRRAVVFKKYLAFELYIYLKIKLQITNRLFINKIEKLPNEYLFIRNVSLMQYKIDMIKSIN